MIENEFAPSRTGDHADRSLQWNKVGKFAASDDNLPEIAHGIFVWTPSTGDNSAMTTATRLLFGPIAAATFFLSVLGLALIVPNYSQVHQSISEIGGVGSPVRFPFAVMQFSYAICLLIFASGIRKAAMNMQRSPLAAYLVGFNALTQMGLATFATPHPVHNVFGLASLFGYQAPITLAIAFRREPSARTLVAFSWIMFMIFWMTLIPNLSSLFSESELWLHVRPVYGLVQRSLLVAWLVWCSGAGVIMWAMARHQLKGMGLGFSAPSAM